MIKVVSIILAIVLVLGFLGSVGFIGYHTIDVITRGATLSEAIPHGWQEYVNLVNNIFGKEVPSTGVIRVNNNITYFEDTVTEDVITDTIYRYW